MARVPATHRPDLEIGPHEAIAEYLDLAWPEHLPWTHFPAGENRGDHVERTDRRTGRAYRYSPSGARLKRMGHKPGWWDFQFLLPNAQFAMAEVKADGGSLSDDQKTHLAKCRALGVAWAIWKTPEDAEITITRWLSVFDLTPRAHLQLRGRP